MKAIAKYGGILLAILLLTVSFSATVYADVVVPVDFYEAYYNDAGQLITTNTPVMNVQSREYSCSTNDCTNLGTFREYQNSGNTNRITYTFPTVAEFPSNGAYGIYAYNDNYIGWEINSTLAGTANFPVQRGYLAQIENCRIGIDQFDVINDVHPNQPIMVNIQASLDSTVTSPIANAGPLTAIPNEIQRTFQVGANVVLEIKDENGALVNTQTEGVLLDFSGSERVEFSYTPSNTGRYTATVTTYANDQKCRSSEPHFSAQSFDVINQGPTEQCYALLDNYDVSAQNTLVGNAVTFSVDKIANLYNEFGVLSALPAELVVEAYNDSGDLVYTTTIQSPANSNVVNAETESFTYTPQSAGYHTVQVSANIPSCPYNTVLSDEVSVSIFTTEPPVVDPNNAPVLSGLPDQTLYANTGFNGNLFDVDNFATDADSDSLSFTVTGESNTAVVDCGLDSSNNVDCQVMANQLGCSVVEITVSDGEDTDTDSFEVCVEVDPNANDAPVLSGLPDQTLYENSGFNNNLFDLDNFASDANNDALSFSITGQTDTSVVTCGIDSSNNVDCQVIANQLGCSVVEVTVSDGEDVDMDSFEVCVEVDPNTNNNVAPVIANLPDQTLYVGSGLNPDLFDLDNYASDTNNDALTFSLTSQSNTPVTTCGIDSNNNIDCIVSNLLGCSVVDVTVSDGQAIDTDSFEVCVINQTTNQTNTPPVWGTVGPFTLVENTGLNNDLVDLDTAVVDAENDALTIGIYAQSAPNVVSCSVDSGNNLDCTIVPNELGCSSVGLIANDGEYTAYGLAQVCVVENTTGGNNTNNAPSWNTIPDQIIYTGSGVNTNLIDVDNFINDADNDPIVVMISNQSNPAVVNCVLENDGTLTCTEFGTQGCSTVTISAFDGTDTSYESFDVCVVNDPNANNAPVANFGNVIMQENDPTTVVATLANNMSDTDNDALALTFVSQSNTDVVSCSLAPNTQLSCTPKANRYGSSVLTFTVSDGVDTITETMVVSVERDVSIYTPTTPDDIDGPNEYIYVSQFKVLNDDCTQSSYDCRDLGLLFNIRNDGDVDYEGLKITMTSFDLGIKRSIGPFDFDEGDVVTREVIIPTYGELPPGYHTIRMTISSKEGIERIVHREIFIRE